MPCSTPLQDPGSPCETTQPRSGALARVPFLRRPYLGPSPSTENRSSPALRPLSEAPRGHRAHSGKFSPSLCSLLAEPAKVKAALAPHCSSEARSAATPFYESLAPPRPTPPRRDTPLARPASEKPAASLPNHSTPPGPDPLLLLD